MITSSKSAAPTVGTTVGPMIGIILLAFGCCFFQAGCRPGGNSLPGDSSLSGPDRAATPSKPATRASSIPKAAETGPLGSAERVLLRESAQEMGIRATQDSGASGNHSYPEIVFGGVCVADFDGDLDLDIYVPQGGALPGATGSQKANLLYLNTGAGKFELGQADPVTKPCYTMGAFAGDIDDDGDLDLLLTNTGSLTLLRNSGNASFKDATAAAGIPQDAGVWLNAVIMDLNGDQITDIYVANYVDWQFEKNRQCKSPSGESEYCSPKNYSGAPDMLLKGVGNGHFENVTDASGIGSLATRSMGVAVLDVEKDGDLDLFVANDGEANVLWICQADGTYRDEAMIRGVAVNSAGKAEASMGVACGDIDADGDEDLIITHLAQETHTVYLNEGGFFVDGTVATGVNRWSRPDTGFGIGLVDLDNDQRLDLFVANGAVVRPTRPTNNKNVYAQVDRWCLGEPRGRFPAAQVIAIDRSLKGSAVSRGAAFGDLDGDGRIDVVVGVKDGQLRVLDNQSPNEHAWIGLRPLPRVGGAVEVGSRVAVLGVAGMDERTVRPHGSYLGSSEHLVRFGLGRIDAPVDVVVTWLDGQREQYSQLPLKQIHQLVRGSGSAVSAGELTANTAKRSDVAAESTNEVSLSPADVTDGDDRSAVSLDATAQIAPSELGAIPLLKIVTESKRKKKPQIDLVALTAWCRQAGLPPPPEIDALDAATWMLVHAAIEEAGRRPTAVTLGSLAMYYDGHRVRSSALELYQRLVKLEPGKALWWHLIGRASTKEGITKQALASYRRAAELLPNEPIIQARLAEASLDAGQTAAAITAWQRYLKNRQNDPIGWTGLAQAQEAAGQVESALDSAGEAIQKRPTARPALIAAARLAARLGDKQKAMIYQQRASKLTKADDPVLADRLENQMLKHSKCEAYLRVSVMHLKKHAKYQQALQAAKLLAERRPDDAQNWQLLVWLSTVLRQNQDAVKYAEIAVEADPKFAPGWETLASAEVQHSNFEKAAQFADRALAADPKFLKAHTARGLALGKLGRHEDALVSLDIALKANPDAIVLWQMKVACHANSGQTELAIKTLDQLLSIAPKHPWAVETRSRLSE